MATLTLEDSGTMLPEYVGNHLPSGTASHIQENLNPICILFTTNFHPLYISLWLFYIFVNAFCKFLKSNWHFTPMIYSGVCGQPVLLAVQLHIKAAGCLAHGSTASNLKSYSLCSCSIAAIYHKHLALICDQRVHARGARKN
jgi:hypothetical protein